MLPTLRKVWRRGRRRLSGRPRQRTQLVYGSGYQVDLPGVAYDFQRGERILAFLDGAGLIDREDVHAAEPIPYRYLRRVHDDDYLLSLTRPGALLPIVGFELPEALAERVLVSQRTMVGGTLAATRLALASRRIAVSLGGGLHHAFAAKGERFCVYNDVATAIADLRAHGNQARVLVVDLISMTATAPARCSPPTLRCTPSRSTTTPRTASRPKRRRRSRWGAAWGTTSIWTPCGRACRRWSSGSRPRSSSISPAAIRRRTTRSATGRSAPARYWSGTASSSPASATAPASRRW